MHEKQSLLRIAKDSDGNFLIDKNKRLEGRGAYICKSPGCLSKALKSQGIERSFGQKSKNKVLQAYNKSEVSIYAQLAVEVER